MEILENFWKAAPEWLDVRQGIRYCGSEEAYRRALRLFADSILQRADEIERLAGKADFEAYAREVHGVKSVARAVGAGRLAERFAEAERAGDARDEEAVRRLTPELLAEYLGCAEPIGELLNKADGALPELAPQEREDAMRSLRELAACRDAEGIAAVLDSLRDYRLAEDDRKRMEAVRRAADARDWPRAEGLLEDGGARRG